MNKHFLLSIAILLFASFTSCEELEDFLDDVIDDENTPENVTISSLEFIGESVIPAGELFEGVEVGGLSSIDYVSGTYYVISDAPSAPIRFYTMDLTFDENSFSDVSILGQVELLNPSGNSFGDGEADPEGIRFDPETNSIVWTSEGFVNNLVDPFIREASLDGAYIRDFNVPSLFLADTTVGIGPRNNGSFEGICLSVDGKGYWAAMELPLEQDGPAPVFGMDTESPVRIAFVDRSGNFGRQFAYELDPVVRDGGFTLNGVVEILEYARDKFLVLERSFATGTTDGGNDVKIYDVDASGATDISSIDALAGVSIIKATKTLLFDFESIRSQLSTVPSSPDNVVDNIEGITFGPDLPNGHTSLVVVADNNFNAFGEQLNQFIVFEVQP